MSNTTDRSRSAAYRFIVGTLRPFFMAITKRDWFGAENLPAEGGYVVCTNHYSHLDPLIFGHFMVDQGQSPRFLGKVEVFDVPIVGALLRSADQIPVYRESGQAATAYRAAVAAVEHGKAVAIYPEGTLTRDPGLWPMKGKTGAARVALQTRCPVIPVANWGAQAVLPPYAKFPKFLPRKTMHIRVGAPVDLSDLYDRPLNHEVLATATERIMTAITRELEIIRGEQAPAQRWDPRRHNQPIIGNPTKEAS